VLPVNTVAAMASGSVQGAVTEYSRLHPAKAYVGICVTALPMRMDVSAVHPANTYVDAVPI
jgi:hypothetical protein